MKISKLFLTALFMSLISLATPAFADTVTANFDLGSSQSLGTLTAALESNGTIGINVSAPNGLIYLGISTGSQIYQFGGDPQYSVNGLPSPFFPTECGTLFGSFEECITSNSDTVSPGGISFQIAEISGQFSSVSELFTPNSDGYEFWIADGDYLQAGANADPTPEPSSLLLLSSGLVGLGFMKRKAFQS
jgi:PEP-CTERM motif